jgi:thioredoxin reductase
LSREVVDVAIIGAGPYGLSLAAHLSSTQRSVRIFGQPMRSWTHQMPQGMSLKSEGFASDLYDPESQFRLKAYCAEKGVDYADVALPVKLDTFINYGLEFQRRYVPNLENTQVTGLSRRDNLFVLTTAAGGIAQARAVVIAAGITHFGYLPPIFSGISSDLLSHSAQHSDLSGFNGKRVGVIGAGASAIDIAVILRQHGVDTQLIARTPTLLFHDAPREPRSFWESVKAPRSGLGTGWRSRMATDIPMVFYTLPEKLRHRAVERHLGPAPCWFTREAVAGLPMHLGATLTKVSASAGRVKIGFQQAGKPAAELEFDHVIAATGYRVALPRLKFIDQSLQADIRTAAQTPLLDRHFESSVPGLYFIGITAANNFGPMLRFAYGAKFAAKRLTARLVERLVRS